MLLATLCSHKFLMYTDMSWGEALFSSQNKDAERAWFSQFTHEREGENGNFLVNSY